MSTTTVDRPVSDEQLVAVLTAARLVEHCRGDVISAAAAVAACNTSAPDGSYAHRLAIAEAERYRERLVRATELVEEAKESLRSVLADLVLERARV